MRNTTHLHLMALLLPLIFCTSWSNSNWTDECQPEISYRSIEGTYISILGKESKELEELLGVVASQKEDFCGATIQITYQSGIETKQLVFEKRIEENTRKEDLDLQIEYISPTYLVSIIGKDGLSIQELSFGGKKEVSEFISPAPFDSEIELKAIWNKERTVSYQQIESTYNQYPEFTLYLKELLPRESIVDPIAGKRSQLDVPSPKETDIPKVKKDSIQGVVEPIVESAPEPKKIENKTIVDEQPIRKRRRNEGTRQPIAKRQPRKSNTKKHQSPPSKSNRSKTASTKRTGPPVTIEEAAPLLKDFVVFELCSKYMISVTNTSGYTIEIEIGNDRTKQSDRHRLSYRHTIYLPNNLDEDSWYKLHYSEELLQADLKGYKRSLESIYEELKISDFGSSMTQFFIDNINDFEPGERYDPHRGERVAVMVDNRMGKTLLTAGVDIFNAYQHEEAKRQVQLFLTLIITAQDLRAYYLELAEKGLPEYYFKDRPNYVNSFPKQMTAGLSIKGGIFGIGTEDKILNENFSSLTVNYRVEAQFGLPFEKAKGRLKNMRYKRTYLVVGYEQMNIPLERTGAVYIGGDYTSTGEKETEFKLQSNEKIILRNHSIQLGGVIKVVESPSYLYLDFGAGIHRRWQSEVVFDKGVNYGVELSKLKHQNALKSGQITPYLQLTIGRNGFAKDNKSGSCVGKMRGLDMFFGGFISRVNFKPGDNYQLYSTSFDNANAEKPFLNVATTKKWYPYLSMGIGFNMF